MVMTQLRSRLQTLISGVNGRVAKRLSSKPGRLRHAPSSSKTTIGHGSLPVPRFGLVGIATLPFASWLALYTYDFYYRFQLCQRAISQSNQEIHPGQTNVATDKAMIGQKAQWQEAQALLTKAPQQIIIISGPRQSGKSLFASSLFEDIHKANRKLRQGAILISLSNPKVDSWSASITRSFVAAFDLKWLHLRHALVDAFPILASNVFVVNDTSHGERDLAQALDVITQALEQHSATTNPSSPRPVIIIDGLGEESFTRSLAGNRSIQHVIDWSMDIATQRSLAHVVLTGNDDWVIRWMEDQSQIDQEKIHILGLSTLGVSEVGPIVLREWPDAKPHEIETLTDSLGGCIPDILASCRAIQQNLDSTILKEDGDSCSEAQRTQIMEQVLSARFRFHMERVITALAHGLATTTTPPTDSIGVERGDENEAYLDNVWYVDSEVDGGSFQGSHPKGRWSQLQLWRTIQRLVESREKYEKMGVPFAELRDNVFGGNITPLWELMKDGILCFDMGSGCQDSPPTWMPEQSWRVTPASSLLCRIFMYLVQNSHMNEYFQNMERLEKRREKLLLNARENRQLRMEQRQLDMRKTSLLQTTELGTALEMDRESLSLSMKEAYDGIVADEIVMERRYQKLRVEREAILQESQSMETKEAVADTKNHVLIHDSLQKAVNEICAQEEERVHQFQISSSKKSHAKAKDLTASDLIRRIKEQTGDEMDVVTAESFIRAWDSNKHTHTHRDYDEFIEMLVADATMQRKKTLKKKRKAESDGLKKSTIAHPEQGEVH
jgi:hypothetical protein